MTVRNIENFVMVSRLIGLSRSLSSWAESELCMRLRRFESNLRLEELRKLQDELLLQGKKIL